MTHCRCARHLSSRQALCPPLPGCSVSRVPELIGPSRASPAQPPPARALSPCVMATYKPVVVQACPKLGERITQDTLYWRGYKVRGSGPVVAVMSLPQNAFFYYFHTIEIFFFKLFLTSKHVMNRSVVMRKLEKN